MAPSPIQPYHHVVRTLTSLWKKFDLVLSILPEVIVSCVNDTYVTLYELLYKMRKGYTNAQMKTVEVLKSVQQQRAQKSNKSKFAIFGEFVGKQLEDLPKKDAIRLQEIQI